MADRSLRKTFSLKQALEQCLESDSDELDDSRDEDYCPSSELSSEESDDMDQILRMYYINFHN